MVAQKDRLILVVDDDEGICDLLSLVIKKMGMRVDIAGDGEEAHRKVLAQRPDLIVLDLILPRYGGFELLRQLQATKLSDVPIIVVTGRYTDRSTVDLIRHESNVIELLEKPVNTARFQAHSSLFKIKHQRFA
jgi:DNA-binding response OmpR family regulator